MPRQGPPEVEGGAEGKQCGAQDDFCKANINIIHVNYNLIMTNTKNLKPELLLKITRGNNIETLHNGWICVLDRNKRVIYKKGNVNDYSFLRSTAKPIQAIPLIENDIKVTQKELAIICGSHSGSEEHIVLLKSLLKKFNLRMSDLQCSIHEPSDKKERNRLLKTNSLPNILHNNCSGKHMGMLSVCKRNNWNLKNYLNPNHPLQRSILNKIKDLSETKNISTAIDGCSAPTFALPIINTGRIFSNFTRDKKYSKIITAMKSNPYLIGGEEQIDSEIIKASSRDRVTQPLLISKVGAEGIIIVAYDGNCAVVKIADGSQKARSIVILRLLLKLGWLKESQIKNTPLEKICDFEIKNCAGKIVGEIKAVF